MSSLFTKSYSAMKIDFWQAPVLSRTSFPDKADIFLHKPYKGNDMSSADEKLCALCATNPGVGFLRGKWACDVCLERAGTYGTPDNPKPFLSRRIFNTLPRIVPIPTVHVHHSAKQPQLSPEEVKIRAVMNHGRQPEEKRRASKKSGCTKKHAGVPAAKNGRPGKKRQSSRSKRFANKRN